MIVKVQYHGLKPEIGDAVGLTKDGRIRKVQWKKLIIGYRFQDIPSIHLNDDEVLIETSLETCV